MSSIFCSDIIDIARSATRLLIIEMMSAMILIATTVRSSFSDSLLPSSRSEDHFSDVTRSAVMDTSNTAVIDKVDIVLRHK